MDTEQDYEAELPLLGWIAGFLRWLEELIVLVSGPLLMAGLGIGLVALLSDGALLLTAPWLLYAWAISQTVGVDGQLVGAWYRVSVAIARRRWGAALAFAALGVLLAYVAYVAALVFATQQTYGLSTAAALARLGMNSTSWLWQRSGVSVLLVCLSGYLRYRAPRHKQVLSLEERKQAIKDQMELDCPQSQAACTASPRCHWDCARHGPGGLAELLLLGDPRRRLPSRSSQMRRDSQTQRVRTRRCEPMWQPLCRCSCPPRQLPMAWPSVHVAEEQTVTAPNGRRSRERHS